MRNFQGAIPPTPPTPPFFLRRIENQSFLRKRGDRGDRPLEMGDRGKDSAHNTKGPDGLVFCITQQTKNIKVSGPFVYKLYTRKKKTFSSYFENHCISR